MVSNAFILAIATTGGFLLVYSKLPKKMRRFIEKHALMADAFALFMTYLLLGGTLTALTAGAMTGLMVSGLLHVSQNKEDFAYLVVAKEKVTEGFSHMTKSLNSWAKQFVKEEPSIPVLVAV